MKYTYAYKTSDGTRHEAAMDAPSREFVFAELRKQGIRAIKVVATDGSKANGEVRGVRKRAVVVIVAFVALAVGVVAFVSGTRRVPPEGRGAGEEVFRQEQFTGTARRQVIGDAAIIAKGIRTGWSDIFSAEGDRFLASFAIPGVKAGVRNTSVEELSAVLNTVVSISAEDSLEAQQIKSMVEGMKAEARSYVSAGGSIVEYGKRLTERQDAEIAVYKRVAEEIEKARTTMSEDAFTSFYEQRNDELRNLGIRPVTLVDDIVGF